ncbi:MAG TPA: 3-methyl-2-oxobutanoate hydroxymethyltransferase, partial [Candidatus Eisenbacteria bacterium]|nr:3-methyl-2-oxobutanoate hydroxymethyltransferase [Candidatus Eisenbacteria bacterium]
GKRWAMLTAYDCPTAEIVDSAGADFVLVGDSLGMVVLGYDSTAAVTMDEMIHHARAVRRGVKRAILVGDLPLKGVEKGPRQALASARRFVREAGCEAVKVEWGPRAAAVTALLTKNRIPVMGHVGLTPQTSKGFHVHGATAADAAAVLAAAKTFESLGAFAVLLECVPEPVGAAVTKALTVPTIGIGAGRSTSGQVLVFHDVMGLFTKFKPRFVKRYAEFEPAMRKAAAAFVSDVARRRFPGPENVFSMKPEELAKFGKLLQKKAG